jgi:hypothetical protein
LLLVAIASSLGGGRGDRHIPFYTAYWIFGDFVGRSSNDLKVIGQDKSYTNVGDTYLVALRNTYCFE